MITNFIQSLQHQEISPEMLKRQFQPGQIFYGKVLKLYPNQVAVVQVGNQRLVANLEVPLSADAKYWFQVESGEGKIHLKVLPMGAQYGDDNSSLTGLLKQMQIPATKENVELINFFIKEQLPVSKEKLLNAHHLLKTNDFSKESFAALKEVFMRNLPVTKETFLSVLSSIKNEPFQNVIQNLRTQLTEGPITKTSEPLLQLIDALLLTGQEKGEKATGQDIRWENGKQVADHLKSLIGKLGFQYENQVLSSLKEAPQLNVQKLESLKAGLLRFLSEEPPAQLKESSERLLHKITGIQLLSNDAGPIQQYVVQVPLSLWNKTTDLTIQWNGRKKENGQIDPDYCRILFYLELEYLNEIIVDMQIQNRVMSIRIISDVTEIQGFAAPFTEGLRNNLDELGFKLSNIAFQKPSVPERKQQSGPKPSYHPTHYTGVDIRI